MTAIATHRVDSPRPHATDGPPKTPQTDAVGTLPAAVGPTPTVSVLMTVYNTRRYLATAVRSVLGQTLQDFELIVVDDGSTDGSAELLRQMAAADARIRPLFKATNTGIARSMNQALLLSRGEFIAKMDSDDVSMPTRLRTQVDYLRVNPGTVGIGAAWEVIDSAGRMLTVLRPPTDNESVQSSLLRGHGAITHSGGMMRRGDLLAAGGYDESFDITEDLDMWLRLGERGRLENLPQVLIQYRVHPKSVSEVRSRDQRQFARRACELAWQRRGIQGTFDADRPWRPDAKTSKARHHFLMQYGWWAFQSGQRRTAMVYGVKAALSRPFKTEGWRLLACAGLKQLPRPRPQV